MEKNTVHLKEKKFSGSNYSSIYSSVAEQSTH